MITMVWVRKTQNGHWLTNRCISESIRGLGRNWLKYLSLFYSQGISIGADYIHWHHRQLFQIDKTVALKPQIAIRIKKKRNREVKRGFSLKRLLIKQSLNLRLEKLDIKKKDSVISLRGFSYQLKESKPGVKPHPGDTSAKRVSCRGHFTLRARKRDWNETLHEL